MMGLFGATPAGLSLLALAVPGLSACDQVPQSSQVAHADFAIQGAINQAVYLDYISFKKRVGNSRITINISSTGGDARVAMMLGDRLLADRVRLRINTVCHSACAQYILPSADEIYIEHGTSIGFHTSPSDLVLPDNVIKATEEQMQHLSQSENSFYIKRGIDPTKVAALRWMTTPVCRLYNPGLAPGDLRAFGLASLYTVVVPSRELLRRMGFQSFDGYWPSSTRQASKDALDRGFDSRFTVRYVDELASKPSERLPSCELRDSP